MNCIANFSPPNKPCLGRFNDLTTKVLFFKSDFQKGNASVCHLPRMIQLDSDCDWRFSKQLRGKNKKKQDSNSSSKYAQTYLVKNGLQYCEMFKIDADH